MRKMLDTIRRWRRRNAAIAELTGLNDRVLEDLGLVRVDIAKLGRRAR